MSPHHIADVCADHHMKESATLRQTKNLTIAPLILIHA
jgi:hypothetical protein